MKILEICLVGYKRFSLNAIRLFRMMPIEKLQLILGTNGSGKSSLLRELSPLPASSNDYLKDGSKTIVVEHRGVIFTLKSVFSPVQRHSFKMGDEEQNQGGTSSVQKELVRKYFGITQDIHDLMVGNTVFNTMSPSERRQWFTLLADVDYTYALGVYKRLSERLRDIQGAIKMNQTRAVQEAGKLLTEEQETAVRAEITAMRMGLNRLLEMKSVSFTFVQDIRNALTSNESEIKKAAQAIMKSRRRFLSYNDFRSVEDIDEAIITESSKIGGLISTIDLVASELQTLQQTAAAMEKFNLSNLEELDTKLKTLFVEISKFKTAVETDIRFDDPVEAFKTLTGLQVNLGDVLTNLEPDQQRRYGRDYYDSLLQKRTNIQQLQLGLEMRHLKALAEKKQQEDERNATPTECPSCHHTWHRGFSQLQYDTICNSIVALTNEQTKNAEALKKLEEEIEQTKSYIETFRAYSEITRMWPVLNPLWRHLLDSAVLFENPKQAIFVIEQVKHSLTLQIQVATMVEEYEGLKKIREATQQNDAGQLSQIRQRSETLETQLYRLSKELEDTRTRIQQLREYKELALIILRHETQLQTLVGDQSVKGKQLVEELKQQAINELISSVQFTLSNKERQLSQIDVQKALVDNIRKQLSELEEQAVVVKLLVKELSPTDGLIARGLLGSINNSVKQINSFIRKVWLYPMELVPMLPDEDNGVDLDYRFSVRINGEIQNPDIKSLSSAQAEIVNLGFRIVAARRLGLMDAPLYLDEFAARMDNAHRASAYNVIANLMTQSEFPQIFVVSHFEDCYGSLRNADMAVLCSKNIALPKDTVYNQHVEIE